MKIEYIGLAEKDSEGYSVFFPDFPGFGSAGNTLEEAEGNAKQGLVAHIDLMSNNYETIPKASSLDEIMKLPDAKECIPLNIELEV